MPSGCESWRGRRMGCPFDALHVYSHIALFVSQQGRPARWLFLSEVVVMDRERQYRADAIILKRMNFGEADRLLTLYTREYGKVRAIAKGVRKTTSRKSGHVELFMRSRLLLARGHDLDIITQAQAIEPYMAMRNDLSRVTYACYAAEMLDRFTPEGEQHQALYDLLVQMLAWLSHDDDLDRLMRFFELRLLDYVGFRPELFFCVRCHAEIKPGRNYFNPIDGGAICPRCAQGQTSLRVLPLRPFKVLRFLQTRSYDVCQQVRISVACHREMEQIMHSYITYHLERRLKSTDFLRLVRNSGAPTDAI